MSYTKHLLTEDGHPYLSPLSSASYYSDEQETGEGSSGWSWNRAKYRVEGRALTDVVETLARVINICPCNVDLYAFTEENIYAIPQDMQSLDTIHKQKLSSYNMAKGQLAVLQRKRTGNLATRDLATVIKKEEVPDVGMSEYLEVVFVAVPKNIQKDFEAKYERLTNMIVPRSAKYVSAIASQIVFTC